MVNGPGVIGLFPIVHKTSELFIYQSVSIMKQLGGFIQGYFVFKVKGTNEAFKAKIDPFYFNLDEGTELIDNPLLALYE